MMMRVVANSPGFKPLSLGRLKRTSTVSESGSTWGLMNATAASAPLIFAFCPIFNAGASARGTCTVATSRSKSTISASGAQLQSRPAIRDTLHLKLLLRQRGTEQRGGFGFIFDNQEAHRL